MEFVSPAAMQTDYFPQEFEHLRIPIAECFTYSTPGLRVISQKIKLPNYDVQFHIFDSEGTALIRPKHGENILTLHYMLQGNIDAGLRRGSRVMLTAQEYNMFQLPSHRHFAQIKKGVYYCFHIILKEKIQQDLRNSLLLFQFLQESFSETGGIINLRPYNMVGYETFLVNQVLNYQKTGPAAIRELEKLINKLVLEFCSKYSQELDAYFSGKKRVSDQELANMLALNAYLTNHLSESHDINRIARQFQIAPDDLENAFMDLYGQRFTDHYTNQRLSRVFAMLANPSKSFEAIAELMGYQSLISLKDAFYEFFGKTMEEVRSLLIRDDDGDS
ncbi:helix-turn-helix domain-containing protein [Chitinophaga pinensis]|uniref:Helix-turn-helix domain-containing protein n=1 Tax=Chitinophaga pinensis TaxID=79329 RepID=A0A5C6LUN0_9BACT|nr:helix-turn-helix domain-containing protein [Chitinophaga pinensis]TWW00414.1 helix-turn-helix domain-containing protein [Chitinophaga pinensis]